MSESNGRKESIDYKEHFRLLRTVIGQSLDDDQVWQNVAASLTAVSKQFNEWGVLMRRIEREPVQKAIKEMGHAFDEFDEYLRDSDRWLEQRSKAYWLRLREGLYNARQKWWKSGAPPKLSSYRKWYEQQPQVLAEEPEERARQRMDAGNCISDFADDLDDAVQDAEEPIELPQERGGSQQRNYDRTASNDSTPHTSAQAPPSEQPWEELRQLVTELRRLILDIRTGQATQAQILALLREMPQKVDAQEEQFREALRQEFAQLRKTLQEANQTQVALLREELREGFTQLREMPPPKPADVQASQLHVELSLSTELRELLQKIVDTQMARDKEKQNNPFLGIPSEKLLGVLRWVLYYKFDEEDMRAFCSDNKITAYDDLEGSKRDAKVRSIVEYYDRHNKINWLINWIQIARPYLSSEELQETMN